MRLLLRRNSSSWEDEDGDGRGVDVVEYHLLFGLALLLSEVSDLSQSFIFISSSSSSNPQFARSVTTVVTDELFCLCD